MIIGIPKEIMNNEGRVALAPNGVEVLVGDGHDVLVEAGAGAASSFGDEAYRAAGAEVVATAEEAWGRADLVIKVKQPLPEEHRYLRADLTVFTYLHLAAEEELTRALVDSGATSIAYETVRGRAGDLPLLAPMSEVAGRLSVIEGAHHLKSVHGGRGVLLPGVPGTPPGKVVVIGGGHVGQAAVAMAHGLRGDVTVLDVNPAALRAIDQQYHGAVRTLFSDPVTVAQEVATADLVVGAVLVTGRRAPKLVSHEQALNMRPGAVVVDVAIDQGGCFEDSRPTSHDEPTFTVGETLFYCVPNMPGAVAHTSTRALGSVTLPYIRRIAADGVDRALAADAGLGEGLITRGGSLVNEAVAQSLNL